MTYNPRINETVTFGDRQGNPKTGTVVRINPKTVSVMVDVDHRWTVPPRLILDPTQTWAEHVKGLERVASTPAGWRVGDTVLFGPGSRFTGLTGEVVSIGPKNTVVLLADYGGRPARVRSPHSYLTIVN